MRDSAAFFAGVRKVTGSLNQIQVDTINGVLKEAAKHPIGWLAYELATAWHEARFEPQPEWGRGKGRAYGKPGKYAQPQYGRGLVQLTWDRNYEWADAALAKAGLIEKGGLLADFDHALEPDLAAFILVRGMEEGAFTGKSLADYLPKRGPANIADFTKARRIVNGTDRAVKIADHALDFQEAIIAGGWA